MYSFDNMIILERPGLLQKIVYDTQAVTLANVALKQKNDCPQSKFQSGKWSLQSHQKILLSTKELDAFNTFLETEQEKIFHQSWKSLWVDKSSEFQREFCSSDMMRQILAKFGVHKQHRPMWVRPIISEIVKTGLINGSWCQGIMQCCLEESDWLLLHECFLHVNDIPECTIVSCLEHFVKHLDEDQFEGSEVRMPENIRTCLSQIFLLPFSENALRKELIRLPFESAMVLVQYLTSALHFSLMSGQVQNWLSLLLDTHATQFILLDKSWRTIDHLHEAVKMQGLIHEELTGVSKLLLQIQSKILPLKRSKNLLYFVELMEI